MSVPLSMPLLGFVAASGDRFNFGAQMERVIPGAKFVELDETHTIFESFFQIKSLKALASPTFQVEPVHLRLHDQEYCEFSDVGWYPIDLSNQANKLGVNYVIYAMTN